MRVLPSEECGVGRTIETGSPPDEGALVVVISSVAVLLWIVGCTTVSGNPADVASLGRPGRPAWWRDEDSSITVLEESFTECGTLGCRILVGSPRLVGSIPPSHPPSELDEEDGASEAELELELEGAVGQ